MAARLAPAQDGEATTDAKDSFLLDQSNPLGFFKALHRGFGARLAAPVQWEQVQALLQQAFDAFERNVAEPADCGGAVACHGGCAACCAIRVAATAPEILLIARTINDLPKRLEIEGKIIDADRMTRRLDPQQRMLAGLVCPFIEQDLCVIYPVRPMACRGHASFDQRACAEAMAGRAGDVPISALHLTVRSLVQNSMQSALRDAGLSWANYELNQGLQIALADNSCEARWLAGEDVFASALIADVSLAEMAETFDAIKAVDL
ncbi:YkgJ family cysteine cluster protein [Methylocapsa acidiphila]|uniref:YkgJ family cysteine cluster protein n=1 Tax=Methylocapsa acidiphila TaxID=133552 RepID=UPI000418F49F|nr:YkgJ family cysteine cluster protein [Methylocapsa acidiphila]